MKTTADHPDPSYRLRNYW